MVGELFNADSPAQYRAFEKEKSDCRIWVPTGPCCGAREGTVTISGPLFIDFPAVFPWAC